MSLRTGSIIAILSLKLLFRLVVLMFVLKLFINFEAKLECGIYCEYLVVLASVFLQIQILYLITIKSIETPGNRR
jgi:hypothetical protein